MVENFFIGRCVNMTKQFYSVKESAKMLGKSQNTIRRWIREGIVPGYRNRISGRLFLSEEVIKKILDNWIEEYIPES